MVTLGPTISFTRYLRCPLSIHELGPSLSPLGERRGGTRWALGAANLVEWAAVAAVVGATEQVVALPDCLAREMGVREVLAVVYRRPPPLVMGSVGGVSAMTS